ncbi:GNAT family N-acetyltransferase [Sandarakinorhabdus oryzae]|uniref:GNAT family N-acetyltransferase n=1 Tax=Sandarakinorhabdus oryzae TaxID=2675220 RepID=UPI0012E24761|nr:GNAT family N-acetyltransferase [Sandarakinorhabdus oryzae]
MDFRPARLPDDEALLIALNIEYLDFVAEGLMARFGVRYDEIVPGGDLPTYLPTVLPGIIGPGPPESIFHIVEQDGQPIAMGGLHRLRDGVAEMKRVYVRDTARGLGLGRALVERLIADARGFGYRRMLLDTMPTLETAIALYERLGFVHIPPYPEVEMSPAMHKYLVCMALDLA